MKKRKRDEQIQFWVTQKEYDKIVQNMESTGLTNLSEYLRVISLSAKMTLNVKMPNIYKATDVQIGPSEEVRPLKRAAG